MAAPDVIAVVNPVAGGGRAGRLWSRLGLDVRCAHTRWPGHARQLAAAAVQAGVRRVIVVGGDGTVSEVAAALVGTSVVLAIVPAGTGNDFAFTLGVPPRADAAAHLALAGSARVVDVGMVERAAPDGGCATFVNVAGCGFDAEVVRCIGRMRAAGGGSLAYLSAVLRTLARAKPIALTLVLDNTLRLRRRAVGVAVANGSHYGGGLHIAPRASVDDGWFDVCVVGDVGAAGLLGLLPFLYAGMHGRYPRVEFFRCRAVDIESATGGGVGCQADGELVGELPVTFRVEPRALRVAAPLARRSASDRQHAERSPRWSVTDGRVGRT